MLELAPGWVYVVWTRASSSYVRCCCCSGLLCLIGCAIMRVWVTSALSGVAGLVEVLIFCCRLRALGASGSKPPSGGGDGPRQTIVVSEDLSSPEVEARTSSSMFTSSPSSLSFFTSAFEVSAVLTSATAIVFELSASSASVLASGGW